MKPSRMFYPTAIFRTAVVIVWFVLAARVNAQTIPRTIDSQTFSQSVPLDPGKVPQQILEQTTPIAPKQSPEPTDVSGRILFSITNTALRYPWLINPTDKITFSPTIFNPTQAGTYLDSDIRFAKQNPNVAKLTFGHFPRSEQFYWSLPNNRVVTETKGWQGGIIHQGSGLDITLRRRTTLSRALTGIQVVNTLPENFAEITGSLDPTNFRIQSAAAQIINPIGSPAVPISLNTGIDLNSANITFISPGVASTNNPRGGISNFRFLEAENTPQVLQGFPTNNLQALLLDGQVRLRQGELIPDSALAALNITWGSTRESKNTPLGNVTSFPGIKTLQFRKFDNYDLLQILTNPSLSRYEREFHYLNSLFWFDFGEREPQIQDTQTEVASTWQRFYLNHPVNQTLLQYDPKEIKATYVNRFINLGASISYSPEQNRVNWKQSLNASLGMLLGSVFFATNPSSLQESLDEAKQQRHSNVKPTPLATAATSEQRQKINQRLNQSLFYSSLASGLEQVSGNLTLSSHITPDSSDLFQVRTGLYRRAVQFFQNDIEPVQVGNTFISFLDTSVNDFGPLTFIGNQIPRSLTAIRPSESVATQVVLTAPDGRQFIQDLNSVTEGVTTLPIGINRAALAFDRIEFSRIDRQTALFYNFNGYISLPSVEAVWNGSSNDLNYAVSSGLWLNVSPNAAANVSENNAGTTEPSLGAYANALLNWNGTQTDLDENNKLVAISRHVPFLKATWNSSISLNNSASVNLGYTFSRQTASFGFSVTPGFLLVHENAATRGVGFLQGNLGIGQGLEFKTSLDYDQNLFWMVEGTQQLSSNWGVGGYLKNYRDFNQGFDTRAIGSSYGLLVKHLIPESRVGIESQIGISDSNMEARIRGSFRF